MCYLTSKAYVSVVMTNFKKKTFEPNYFCSMFLPICKPSKYTFLDPKADAKQILADKPEFIKNNDFINNLYKEIESDKNRAGRETILAYHISDMHLLLDYKPGTNSDCTGYTCCNEKAGKPKSKSAEAGKWGDYNCDSNPATIDLLKSAVEKTGKPDFILWTGDSNDHGIEFEPEVSTNSTIHITKKLLEMFPDTVIFPIHGNHEYSPMNLHDFSKQSNDVIGLIGNAWSDWLTPEVKSEFIKKSYFSYDSVQHPKSSADFKRKMKNTHIIALNTQNCYSYNFFLDGEFNDAGNQVEWLEDTLREIERNGELAIIIGHIPPGEIDCSNPVSERYRILLDRFQHVIRLNLYGHTHFEEFEVIKSIEGEKAIGVNHITSSFTPHQNQNPSFRVITLDVETKLPIRIETYTMDLAKANQDDANAVFSFNHEFADVYGLKDLSPNSTQQLTMKIRDDEQTAKMYAINKLAHGRGSAEIAVNKCNES